MNLSHSVSYNFKFFVFDLRHSKVKPNAQPRPNSKKMQEKTIEWTDALVPLTSYGEIASTSRTNT